MPQYLKKPSVCVLMSTYNGEQFIREQLESICSQNGVNVTLLIRDDGSKDNTLSILKSFEEKIPMRVITDGENLGPGNSFMELVYQAGDFDFYAFSDQDDIWKNNKLERFSIFILLKSIHL